MTDRLFRLARVLLLSAQAEEAAARTLARERGRIVKELEQLLASWEAEDFPDGPLFGGLPLGTGATQEGVSPPAPPPAPAPSVPPARQSASQAQRGHVEVVKEWAVYRRDSTDRLGTVNATTEPSALARAIEHHGPDVWVCPVGGTEEAPAPIESLKREEVREELAKTGIDPDVAVARVKEAIAAAGQPEQGGPMDLRHVSWDAACTFFVLLDDRRPVECTWHPDHAYAQGCGEPGRLELHGPVSAEGFRATPIPPGQRNEPLAEVACRRAQEAHDAEQMRLASPGKVKEPSKRRRKKGPLVTEGGGE